MIKCIYLNNCYTGMEHPEKCKRCGNNSLRNYKEDYFIESTDNPIPEKCPKLTFDGPAEQTVGYICPVCGHGTNPYQMTEEGICLGCGYKLNI